MIISRNFSFILLVSFSLALADDVSCGGHVAVTCADCPMGDGIDRVSSWYNGDCEWNNEQCKLPGSDPPTEIPSPPNDKSDISLMTKLTETPTRVSTILLKSEAFCNCHSILPNLCQNDYLLKFFLHSISILQSCFGRRCFLWRTCCCHMRRLSNEGWY